MTEVSADRRRRAEIAGVVGPTAFVAAWIVGALVNDRDLGTLDDAISQLAHVDSNTRWLMSLGFVTFAIGVGWFAVGVDAVLGRPTAIALAVTAASTLMVAALPLGASDTIDRVHGIAAGIGYLSLALTPALACRPLRHLGRSGLAIGGVVASSAAAISLAVSLSSAPTGAFQRLGLTTVDIWIVALAATLGSMRRATTRRRISSDATASNHCSTNRRHPRADGRR